MGDGERGAGSHFCIFDSLQQRVSSSRGTVIGQRVCFDQLGHENTQKCVTECCEAITRLASFTAADTLTDRQLKLSVPGMHSIHASSSSQSSVRELEAPGPIKLVIELMKLFSSRSGTEDPLSPFPRLFSVDLWLWDQSQLGHGISRF